MLTVSEKVMVALNKDGGVRDLEVQGSMALQVGCAWLLRLLQEEAGSVSCLSWSGLLLKSPQRSCQPHCAPASKLCASVGTDQGGVGLRAWSGLAQDSRALPAGRVLCRSTCCKRRQLAASSTSHVQLPCAAERCRSLPQVLVDDHAFIQVAVQAGANEGYQFKTHPNIDKALYSSRSLLGLKDVDRPFPTGSPLQIIKWRMQARRWYAS